MKVEGFVTPPKGAKNKYWSVEVPALEIYTQGKSKKDAYAMIQDAVEVLVDKEGFQALVTPGEGNSFTVTSEDTAAFLAFVLGRIRSARNLSARDVAERLNSSSPNAYARYEQGKSVPTVEKFEELIKAIDPNLSLVLKAG